MSKTIIGLAGPKQSGKTSAAVKLEKSGFVRYSFAAPVRAMLTTFLTEMGRTEADINTLLNIDKTMRPPGTTKTSRDLLQTLGTEWGRTCVDQDIWTMAAFAKIKRRNDDYIVFDDVRFENEATLIRDLGGLIIHVDRGGLVQDDHHASESGITKQPDDEVVRNNDSLDDFLLDVSIVVAGFIGQ